MDLQKQKESEPFVPSENQQEDLIPISTLLEQGKVTPEVVQEVIEIYLASPPISEYQQIIVASGGEKEEE